MTPSSESSRKFQDAVLRLPKFLDKGFVVSLNGDQKIHQGDSLLFSGLALYALDKQSGQPIADAFAKMMEERDGGTYRHPDMPDRETSLDGLLGLYRGIAKRINLCDEKPLWAKVMKNHRARMAASLPAEFNLVADALAFRLGLADSPDIRRISNLALEVSTWATLVKRGRRSCYRIHLGLLALQGMEDLGFPVSPDDKAKFADATSGTKMPTVDEFCGRPAIEAFLKDFTYNKWQYQHQRNPVWEAPDGYGQDHPAIDYLVGYADLHGSPK